MQKRMIHRTLVLLLIISGAMAVTAAAEEKKTIPYSDINRRFIVTGPLGTALGTVMVLEVEKIAINEKSQAANLLVVKVNGALLARPVRMRYRMLIADDSMKPGEKYRVKAYQDGSFTGTPSAVLRDVMFQTADYHFEVVLVIYQFIK
jgi:hypothetical protein